jgi:hypothetical protein
MRGNEHSIIHAIRGPVTLITIGVLFTLQNFTRYSFDQTWPVILIVFGLLSLVGRGMGPQRPVAPPPAWPQPGIRPPAANPAQGNYPPPGSQAAGSYRQSQYQPPAAPAGSRGGTKESGPNPPSGPAGGSV